MIVPDVNLLLYAYNSAAPEHGKAKVWWEDLVNSQRPVGLPWAVVFGFIRLSTHRSVLATPLPPEVALRIVSSWTKNLSVRMVNPGFRHLEIATQLFKATGVGGNLTTDTHLAAIAIEHQAELHSNDNDFARFPGLRFRNPLS